jgi:hypothetical protein
VQLDADPNEAVVVGDGQLWLLIPSDLDGWNLVEAAGFVVTASSSGNVQMQVRNVTQAADMLSTKITVEVSELTSYTAASQPVVDTANDDVAVGDLIAIDVDSAGTNAEGRGVVLVFEFPPP